MRQPAGRRPPAAEGVAPAERPYSEPAAFHRSFRRWAGETPLAYRRRFRAA